MFSRLSGEEGYCMITAVGYGGLSEETREWMQVMQSLGRGSKNVCYDDLCAVELSGMFEALRELEDADLVRWWGGSSGVYYEMLWL